MKKHLYILVIFILYVFISCSKNDKISLTEEYAFLKPNFESTVKVDFSKEGIDLIEDFENQIQKDICQTTPFLNGEIVKNKEILSFPLIVYKYCGALAHFRNRIPIIISKKNEVLIDDQFIVQSNGIVKDYLIEATDYLIETEKKKTIVYLLNWDEKADPILITERLIEILESIKAYINQLSLNRYNKQISELNENELTEIKKDYNPLIGIEENIMVLDSPLPTE